jgi:hypothetical protein
MIRARCDSCGERYPAWDEHTCAASKERPLPARESVNNKPAATPGVNAGVNAKRAGDRHAPGYMAEYMRKRRAGKRVDGSQAQG